MSGLFRAARLAGPVSALSAKNTRHSIVGISRAHKGLFTNNFALPCKLLRRSNSGISLRSNDAIKSSDIVRTDLQFQLFRKQLFSFVRAEDVNGFWDTVKTIQTDMSLSHFGYIFSTVGSCRIFYGRKASAHSSAALISKLNEYVRFTFSNELGGAQYADTPLVISNICDLFHGFQWMDQSVHGDLLALLVDLSPILERAKLTSSQVALCLYKMHSMGHLLTSYAPTSGDNSQDSHYHRIIEMWSNKLETSDQPLKLPIICGLFLSLGNASNVHPAARKLLRIATSKLKGHYADVAEGSRFIPIESLTKVLSGIRAMSLSDRSVDERHEVTDLLNFVSTLRLESSEARPTSIDARSHLNNRSPRPYTSSKIKDLDYVNISGSQVSLTLNSLRNYTSAEEPAKAVLQMLDTQLVRRLPPSLSMDAKMVARALQGVRFMDMSCEHTANIVSFLCAKLKQSGFCGADEMKSIIFSMFNMKNGGDALLLEVIPFILDNYHKNIPGICAVYMVKALKTVLADSHATPEVTKEVKETIWRRLVKAMLANPGQLDLWYDKDVIKIIRTITPANQRLLGEIIPVLVQVLNNRRKRPHETYEWIAKDVVGVISALAVLEDRGVHSYANSEHTRALSDLVIRKIYSSSRDMEQIVNDVKANEPLTAALQGVLQLVSARNKSLEEERKLVKEFGYDVKDISLGLQSIKAALMMENYTSSPEHNQETQYDIETIKSTISSLVDTSHSAPLSEPRPSQPYAQLDFFKSLGILKELAANDDISGKDFWDYVDTNVQKFNISHISLIFGMCWTNYRTKPGYLINPYFAKKIASVLHERLQLNRSDQDAVTPRVLSNCLRGIAALHFHPRRLDVATLQTILRSVTLMASYLQHAPMTIEEVSACIYPLRHAMFYYSSVLRKEATPLLCLLAAKLGESDPLSGTGTTTTSTSSSSSAAKPMTIAQINMCLEALPHFAITPLLEFDQQATDAISIILRTTTAHLRERRFLDAAALTEGLFLEQDANGSEWTRNHNIAKFKRLMTLVSYVKGVRVREYGDPLADEVRALVSQVDDAMRAMCDSNKGLISSGGWRESPAWQERLPELILGLSNKSDTYPEFVSLMKTINTYLLPSVDEGSRPGSTGTLLKSVFSLHSMDCSTPEVLHLMNFLIDRIDAINSGPVVAQTHEETRMWGDHVDTCVTRTKSMKNCQLVYPKLVAALLGTSENRKQGVLAQCVKTRCLVTMLPPVYDKEIVESVVWRARQLTLPWSAKYISQLLFSMHNYSSDEASVRALLSVLTERMQKCRDQFSITNILSCLHGLRGLSSKEEEVRQLLVQLTAKVRSASRSTHRSTIEEALGSLDNLDLNQREVVDLVTALTALVHEERYAQAQPDDRETEGLRLGGARPLHKPLGVPSPGRGGV